MGCNHCDLRDMVLMKMSDSTAAMPMSTAMRIVMALMIVKMRRRGFLCTRDFSDRGLTGCGGAAGVGADTPSSDM